jgi:hypothetical protein
LTQHRADRADIVRAVLEEAGITPPDARRLAADTLDELGRPRFVWHDIPADERNYTATVVAAVRQARAWREQYTTARDRLDALGPPGTEGGCSFGNHTRPASRYPAEPGPLIGGPG